MCVCEPINSILIQIFSRTTVMVFNILNSPFKNYGALIFIYLFIDKDYGGLLFCIYLFIF